MKKTTTRNILRVTLRGCVATLGAIVALASVVIAVILYIQAATEFGYIAVGKFIGATVMMAWFLVAIYALGAYVANAGNPSC